MAVEGWSRRGRVDVDGMHGMNDTCGSRSREECGLVWQAVGGFGGLLSLFGGGVCLNGLRNVGTRQPSLSSCDSS